MASPVDPFPSTCDPAAYVPRPATEAALEQLASALEGPAACVALTGPPGIGKTMLLRVLAARGKGKAQFVYLPYAAVDIADLARWVVGQVGAREPLSPLLPDWEAHPVAALARLARSRTGGPLVLLLDDASALGPDTARQLAALVRDLAGALRAVVVPIEDGRAGRLLAALGPDVIEVRLDERLSADEVGAYVRTRLGAAGAQPAVREAFDDSVIAWLLRESGGIPLVVHELANRFLHDGEMGRPAAVHRDAGLWLEVDAEGEGEEPTTVEIDLAEEPGRADEGVPERPGLESPLRAAPRPSPKRAAAPAGRSRRPSARAMRWLLGVAVFAGAFFAGWLLSGGP